MPIEQLFVPKASEAETMFWLFAAQWLNNHKHGHSDNNGNGVEDNGADVDGAGGGEHHYRANVDDVEEWKQEGLAGCQTQWSQSQPNETTPVFRHKLQKILIYDCFIVNCTFT